MSILFRQLTHLFPRSRAWDMTQNKMLQRFGIGLTEGISKTLNDFNTRMFENSWVETTNEIEEWEYQHGIIYPAESDEDRIAALVAEELALGGQSREYLEETLRAAGFDVYVHEPWFTGRTAYDIMGMFYARKKFVSGIVGATDPCLTFDARGENLFIGYTVGSSVKIDKYKLRYAYAIDFVQSFEGTYDAPFSFTSLSSMRFSPDGKSLYMLDTASASLWQHELEFAYDLDSVINNYQYGISGLLSSPTGFHISDDGLKLNFVGENSGLAIVRSYAMSTAWALHTASYASKYLDIFAAIDHPKSIQFSADGTRMVISDGNLSKSLYEYRLAIAWDVTSNLAPAYSDAFSAIAGSERVTEFIFSGNNGEGEADDLGSQLFAITDALTVYQFSVADHEARNPNDYLTNPNIGVVTCGGLNNTCRGDYASAIKVPNYVIVCSERSTGDVDYLNNKDNSTRRALPLSSNIYEYPFFAYVGGQNFGDIAEVSADRRREFERLILKLFPAQIWIGLFIDYKTGLIKTVGDNFIEVDSDELIIVS